MTYTEKLKDPRWQKKRLEILNAAGWKCAECGNGEDTLHVHHLRYIKGRSPWEYDREDLKCLCEGCHDKAHNKPAASKTAVPFSDTDHNWHQCSIGVRALYLLLPRWRHAIEKTINPIWFHPKRMTASELSRKVTYLEGQSIQRRESIEIAAFIRATAMFLRDCSVNSRVRPIEFDLAANTDDHEAAVELLNKRTCILRELREEIVVPAELPNAA